jgi:hypothetical protein
MAAPLSRSRGLLTRRSFPVAHMLVRLETLARWRDEGIVYNEDGGEGTKASMDGQNHGQGGMRRRFAHAQGLFDSSIGAGMAEHNMGTPIPQRITEDVTFPPRSFSLTHIHQIPPTSRLARGMRMAELHLVYSLDNFDGETINESRDGDF